MTVKRAKTAVTKSSATVSKKKTASTSSLYQIDGCDEWIDVVLRELSHHDSNRRKSAVSALSKFNKSSKTTNACFTAFELDSDYFVRSAALLSLCEIFEGKNWPSAEEEIVKTLPVCSDDKYIRKG